MSDIPEKNESDANDSLIGRNPLDIPTAPLENPPADKSGTSPPVEDDSLGQSLKTSGTAVGGSYAPSNAGNVTEMLDLTQEVEAKTEKAPEPAGDYDPRPVEDGARRTIAYLLIGLLWVIVSAILIMLAWQSVEIKDLKEFGVLLSPIIVLVSAATGFYYGTKSSGK